MAQVVILGHIGDLSPTGRWSRVSLPTRARVTLYGTTEDELFVATDPGEPYDCRTWISDDGGMSFKVVRGGARREEVLVSGAAIQFTAGQASSFDIDAATSSAVPGAGAIQSITPTLTLTGVSMDAANGQIDYNGTSPAASIAQTDYLVQRAGTRILIRYRVPSVSIVATITAPQNLQVSAGVTGALEDPAGVLAWSPVSGATGYRVYRSATSAVAGFSAVADVSPTPGYTDPVLGAASHDLTYWWYVTALSGAIEGPASSVVTIRMVPGFISAPASPLTLARGASYDLSAHIRDTSSRLQSVGYAVGSAQPSGVSAPTGASHTITAAVDAPLGTTPGVQYKANYGAEADWQFRISGTGVVWYHDFRNAAEVNAFRWTGGYGSGNDPNSNGSNSQYVTRQPDGPTGWCLEIKWPSAGQFGNSHWWRPMAPLVGTGNGRGQNDPAANGSLTVRPYAPTDGGNQIAAFPDWGFYGEQGGSAFDGTEYYLQIRIKMDPARISAGLNPGGNQFGKLCYFTRTDQSLTTQEINTESYQNGAAGRNYFSMYRSGSPPLEGDAPGQGNQPGNQNGVVWFDNRDGSAANAFYWPNPAQWVTVLYHVVPKLTYTTVVQVWIAREGETSYTKIWDMNTVQLDYGSGHPFGHNAVLLTAYNNQLNALNGFYHRYTQLIFSKNTIPCPQV